MCSKCQWPMLGTGSRSLTKITYRAAVSHKIIYRAEVSQKIIYRAAVLTKKYIPGGGITKKLYIGHGLSKKYIPGRRLTKKVYTGPRSHKGWETLVWYFLTLSSSVSFTQYFACCYNVFLLSFSQDVPQTLITVLLVQLFINIFISIKFL
jgi:hypothetical protein